MFYRQKFTTENGGNEYTVNFVNLHVLLKLFSFSRTLIVIDCRLRLLLFPLCRVKGRHSNLWSPYDRDLVGT